MGKHGNVPTDIQDGVRDALGDKTKIAYARIVNLETKPDKFEARVLALNNHRVFILTPKIPMKLETNLHFLDINLLESKSPQKMVIGTELKRLVMSSNSMDENSDEFDHFVGHIIISLAKIFPNVSTEKLIAKVDFTPPARLEDFRRIAADIGQTDEGPCGNFSTMYRCVCDYHNMVVQEDVAWDVDMIYLSQDSKEMNLKDFDHLDSRHLLPVISALEHNMWFTRLNATNVKLSPEAINEILKIMKTNRTIEELVLANIGIRVDFCQRLCVSLVANAGSPLTTLDLSGNIIEDRGLIHLCASITKLSRGLVELNLAQTGITAKGVNKLSEALLGNKNIPLNLHHLDLSENSFKGEDVSNLFNFLAQPNALTDLRLAATECSLESLFSALQRGCSQNLANLDISNNLFSCKKHGKDATVPPSWKQFFASALSLKNINFSGSRLPPDALRSVLEGIGSNPSLTDLELDLSSNGFGLPGNHGAQILETCLCNIRNISHLDLSDNGFDSALANILVKLSQNKGLRKLSIGRNLNNIKPKNVPQVIEAVIQLIHQENSPIRCLNLDNLRLKSETVLLINALGTNDTLTEIDISGNQMGDTGARMLSKALLINKKLSVIHWDHNGTSPHGFQDIAAALEKNFSLHEMPMPINDAAQALHANQEKTEHALKKIESVLRRNNSHRKVRTDQAYRLHQCLMIGTFQQTIDAHLVQLQDNIEKCENLRQKYQLGSGHSNGQEEVAKAQALLKETDCTKTLLLQLQRIVKESGSSNSLQKDLNALGSSLCDVVTKQLKANVSAMIACAENQFPVTLKNEALQKELMMSSEAMSQLPAEFFQTLIVDQLSVEIANKMSGLDLLAASHIFDRILDEVKNEVAKSVQSLKSILNSTRSQLLVSGQLKDEDTESKDHRENLKRQKTAADEDQDAATEMPSLLSNHRSQLSRRIRPQSAIDAADVKKALELCRGKTDFSASSDLELRVDSGHERSSSEERLLESDDSKSSSPVLAQPPRKRRGQPNGNVRDVGACSGSEFSFSSAHEKTVAGVGKGGVPHKSLNADHGDRLSQAKRSSQFFEQDAVDVMTAPSAVTTGLQQKSELNAPSSKGAPSSAGECAGQCKSDPVSLSSLEGISRAITSAGELLQRVASETPGFLFSSSEVVNGNENSEGSSIDRSFAGPSETAIEEQAEVLKLKETAKGTLLDRDDGKSLEATAAKSNLHVSGMDFLPTNDVSVPKLEHLVKDRPKRPKRNTVTRATAFDPVTNEDDISRGVNDFFDAKLHLQAERMENGELTVCEESEEVVKSETSKKTEKAKEAAFSPKVESKGFASNLKNLLKKKSPEGDTPPSARKSGDDLSIPESNLTSQRNKEKSLERLDNLKPSEELNKRETEEPESRPKQPPGVAKIGLPGMAGGVNLAELRSKKAAPKRVTSLIESGKSSAAEITREKELGPVKKSSLSKEASELPSTEDNISGVSSHLSGSSKGRPPPPLAPKPNKRATVGTSIPAPITTTSTTATAVAQKPAVSITRGLSEAEAVQESDQKTDALQTIDAAATDRKKRMSVREKAARIDKNSNLKLVDGSMVSKKPVTQPADSSAKSSESLAHQPSSEASLTSSSLSTLGPESETPVLPSDPPSDAVNDGDTKSKSAAKRQLDVDVTHI